MINWKGKRAYISGPMTHIEGFNFDQFNHVAARLVNEVGMEVENPADKGIIEGWSWADYLKFDIRALTTCDVVALLPGWAESRGARFEVDVADRLGITTLPWKLLLPGEHKGMV